MLTTYCRVPATHNKCVVMARVLGQSVVVDNKGGGSGNVAYGLVARAIPDGYTLLTSYSAYHVGNPALSP